MSRGGGGDVVSERTRLTCYAFEFPVCSHAHAHTAMNEARKERRSKRLEKKNQQQKQKKQTKKKRTAIVTESEFLVKIIHESKKIKIDRSTNQFFSSPIIFQLKRDEKKKNKTTGSSYN